MKRPVATSDLHHMKKFLTSALASLSLLAPNAAFADNTFDDHLELNKALQSAGIVVVFNSKLHCNGNNDGMYLSDVGMLVVCQDNSYPGGPQVDWTANDLDTLRHEAHHVVQDCSIGGIGDLKMDLLFSDKESFVDFMSKSSLSVPELKRLTEMLENEGLTKREVLMEVEAYVVARDIGASTIANKVKDFCD